MAKIYTMQRKVDSNGTLEIIYPRTSSSQIITTTDKFFATNDQITKLSGIEDGAEANILNQISLNGSVNYTIANKNINITNVISLVNGRVPTSYMPDGYDDVIEGYYYSQKFYTDSAHTTEIRGVAGQIYLDCSTNKIYRWSGSIYVELSNPQSLGYWFDNGRETTYVEGDLYRGDVGTDDATSLTLLSANVNRTKELNTNLSDRYSNSDNTGVFDKYTAILGTNSLGNQITVAKAYSAKQWTTGIPVEFYLSLDGTMSNTTCISSGSINASGAEFNITLPAITTAGSYDYLKTNSAGQVISGLQSVLFSDLSLGDITSLCTDGLYFSYVSAIN